MNTKNPKVTLSVLLISYNHERYIRECLKSIFNQVVDFDYELIVLDDASSDRTQDIITSEINNFKYVKVFFNKRNMGGAFTHRYGKRHAQAEYIINIEGDDFWTDKYKLQKQYNFLKKNKNCIGCCHKSSVIQKSKNSLKFIKSGSIPENCNKTVLNINDLISDTYFHTTTYMWRNVFIPTYPKEHFFNDQFGDLFLAFLYTREGSNVGYIDSIMSCYRVTFEGVWTSLAKSDQAYRNFKGLYLYNKLLDEKFFSSFWVNFRNIGFFIKNNLCVNVFSLKSVWIYLQLICIHKATFSKNKLTDLPHLSSGKMFYLFSNFFFDFMFHLLNLFFPFRYKTYFKIKIYDFFKLNPYIRRQANHD